MNSDRLSFDCPVCGECVPRNAKSCPECGACEKSGWSADAGYDATPGDDFNYESFVAAEFGGKPAGSRKEKFWWLAAVIVLVAFTWLILHGR